MLVSAFDFILPDDLIAQHPQEPRDGSRLMVVDRQRACWHHQRFDELADLLDPGDSWCGTTPRWCRLGWSADVRTPVANGKGCFCASCLAVMGDAGNDSRTTKAWANTSWLDQGLNLRLEARGNAGQWIVRPLVLELAATCQPSSC